MQQDGTWMRVRGGLPGVQREVRATAMASTTSKAAMAPLTAAGYKPPVAAATRARSPDGS